MGGSATWEGATQELCHAMYPRPVKPHVAPEWSSTPRREGDCFDLFGLASVCSTTASGDASTEHGQEQEQNPVAHLNHSGRNAPCVDSPCVGKTLGGNSRKAECAKPKQLVMVNATDHSGY